jgi:hypothetical protein
MQPLFSPDCDHVAWIDPKLGSIFDRQMRFVAFVAGENAWSAETLIWLGQVDVVTLRDRSGKPVAWNPDRVPTGATASPPPGAPGRPKVPMRPKTPLPPRRPLRPRHPLSGWSWLTFAEWLNGGAPVAAPQPEAAEDLGSSGETVDAGAAESDREDTLGVDLPSRENTEP